MEDQVNLKQQGFSQALRKFRNYREIFAIVAKCKNVAIAEKLDQNFAS